MTLLLLIAESSLTTSCLFSMCNRDGLTYLLIYLSSIYEHPSGGLQALILKELQRVYQRLNDVEAKVQDRRHRNRSDKDCPKLSRSKYLSKMMLKVKRVKKSKFSSESSSDEELLPPLSVLRTSREIQSKIDARISEIESHSKVQGNESSKLKSKRGEG